MSGPSQVEELIRRLAAGELAEPVRLAAARGALPLPPGDLLRVQGHLALHDPDDAVREAAGDSLRARAPAETAALLREAEGPHEAAAYFAAAPETDAGVLEAIAQNPATHDDVLARLAVRQEPPVIETLLLNQERLIRSSVLREALAANPTLSPGQRRRLEEIQRHFVDMPAISAEEEAELGPELAAELAADMAAAEMAEPAVGGEPAAAEALAQEALGQAADDKGADGRSVYQRLLELRPAEKVKLAFQGSAEERSLLIRDKNRVVAQAVLKSPRTQEKDIEGYVKMRSLSEEILRGISMNREWMRSYAVVLGLLRNPKTPPGTAISLIQRVNNRDLQNLARDRNISEIVRQQARKSFVARTQGGQRKR